MGAPLKDGGPAFDNATYYDCSDPEQLAHETVADALESIFDYSYEQGESITACIARLAPVIVTAYERMAIDEKWCARQAERLAENLTQTLEEEFGNPDGTTLVIENTQPIEALIRAAVDRAAKEARVWGCEAVATREYSATEIEAVLRAHCPSWFEEETQPAQRSRP